MNLVTTSAQLDSRITRRSILIGGGLLAATRATASEIIPLGCSPEDATLACFQLFRFTDSKGQSHTIYAGGSGPPVLVLHELPGLTFDDIRLGKRLICAGFTVLLPLLFGEPGDNRLVHNLFHVCGRSQFDCNGSNRTPEPVKWLREFCAAVPETWPSSRGMGAIGMCLTGAFPLALLSDDNLTAPVLCQPTSPFSFLSFLGLTRHSSRIGVADEDLLCAQAKPSMRILAIRYAADPLCPSARLNALATRFGDRFFRLDLGGKHRHSTLGHDLSCVAFEEVLAFLRHRLIDPGSRFPLCSIPNAIDPPLTAGAGCGVDPNACPSPTPAKAP